VLHWLLVSIIKNYIFPPLLYGCETWSITFWEMYGLKVFENRVLMKLFRPTGEG